MKRPQLQHGISKLPPSKKLRGSNFGVLTQNDYAQVSHGFLSDIDLRTRRGRLMLSAYAQYCEDKGGENSLTFAQKELIRRAATFAMVCSDMEERFSEGSYDENDFAQYAIATRTLATLLKQVGISFDSNELKTLTLDDYLSE